MNFIQLIQDKADSCGMTVHGLFRAAGVSYTNWWRYQTGKTKPNMDTLDKLMAVEPNETDSESISG